MRICLRRLHKFTIITFVLPFCVGLGPMSAFWSTQRTYCCVIRSTLLSRPNKVGLNFSNVRPSVRPYYVFVGLRLFTISFFQFQWNLACRYRGRWLMHDGMQYDPIQGQDQGQGHDSRALESWKSFYFQKLCPSPVTMGARNWPLIPKLGAQYLNLIGPDFLYLSCHVTLNLAETSVVKSRPSVLHGANFINIGCITAVARCGLLLQTE